MVDAIRLVEQSVAHFVDGVAAAIPALLSGFVFLVLAYIGIRLVLAVVRPSLERVYPGDRTLVANLVVTVVAVFLWFGVALAFLKIVGLGDIAASLGTAVGFIALGVSYALSDMIADTVAGVYLLRDPDFNVGDRVTTGSVSGTVRGIELRKSRIETENGDVTVLANRDVEEKWTRRTGEGD